MDWKDDTAFCTAVKIVLEHEGGYTDNRLDPGNWTGGRIGRGQLKGTKYGISAETYPELDILTLTEDDASAIYYRDWWTKYRYAEMPTAIGAKCLDLAVMAPAAAHRALQRAVRACHGPTLKDDGEVGSLTIDAVNHADAGALLAAFKSEYAGYCRMVNISKTAKGESDPFLDGWLRRAYA